MKRRSFIKVSLTAGTVPLLQTGCHDNSIHSNKKITGFIFSDAHIGWRNKTQPSLETQALMIERINSFFPDLDLVFDTGDIHHSYLKEPQRMEARNFWLSKMAGKFPTSLLHYIPGNHELGRGTTDPEIIASSLGSMNFRPYYSFDYKGIHFVALPQLLNTILISRESLNWLKQDLLINKDKSTIIFSHNSLQDTTFTNNETGYRVTVNSDEVYETINKHNNVIGWFHGHNHQYEIVKKHNRLYVSNGRIGGFNPPQSWGDFGQGHLGGIYFEIDHNGLTVKCFSASKNAFLENLGFPHLSNKLALPTSIQHNAATNYYWGHGKMLNKVPYRFFNHYLTNDTPFTIISPNIDTVINENNSLKYETNFYFAGRTINRIIGYQLIPGKLKVIKTPKGLVIDTDNHNKAEIKFPHNRNGYYRCAKNDTYKLSAVFSNLDENVVINYSYEVLDIKQKTCLKKPISQAVKIQENKYEAIIKIPNKFLVQPADDRIYLFITLQIINPGKKLMINKIDLFQTATSKVDPNKSLTINGDFFYFSENNPINKTNALSLATGYFSFSDNQASHTLLAKIPNVQWQIRNATAQLVGNKIHIQSLRHKFQRNPEIIITPTSKKTNYINRLINIESCVISYHHNKVIITDIKALGEPNIVFNTLVKTLQVKGGRQIKNLKDKSVKIYVDNISKLSIRF